MRDFESKLNTSPNQTPKRSIELDQAGQAEIERKFEDYLKKNVILQTKKINEGNAGVIGLIDLDRLPPEIAASFEESRQSQTDSSSHLATKILKIYQFGAGKQEFAIQKRAHDLIRQANSEEFVKIPQIYIYRQLDLEDRDIELKNKLETDGIDVSSKKCDLMLMDFIPGDDFGSYLYKEVIKNATDRDLFNDQELLDFREEIRSGKAKPSLGQLDEVVDILVDLQYSDREKNIRQKMDIDQSNYFKIIKFLQQRNFQLDGSKFGKIKKTLDYLHKNGIYHRDLHERNIMLTYDEAGNIADFYLIDFGLAIDLKVSPGEEAYQDNDHVYRDDNFILRVCDALTKKPDDLKREKTFKLLDGLEKMSQRLLSRLADKKLWTQAISATNVAELSENIEEIVRQFTRDPDGAWEIRNALTAEIAKSNTALAKEYIKYNLKIAPLAVKNELDQINRLF